MAAHVCLPAPSTPSLEAAEAQESGTHSEPPWLTESQPFCLFAVAPHALADGTEITLMGTDSRKDERTPTELENVNSACGKTGHRHGPVNNRSLRIRAMAFRGFVFCFNHKTQ